MNMNKIGMLQFKRFGIRPEYFDENGKIGFPRWNIDLYPGFHASVTENEMGLCLNVDIKTRVVRTETVMDLIIKSRERSRGSNWKTAVEEDVNGRIILTTYGDQKTYRVDHICWDIPVTKTFPFQKKEKQGDVMVLLGEPVQTSYVQYFRDVYKVNLRHQDQPMLECRVRRRGQEDLIVHIPSELCRTTGLTDEMRGNFQLMKDLSLKMHSGPEERATHIQKFVRRICNAAEPAEKLKKWGAVIHDDFMKCTGVEMQQNEILWKRSTAKVVRADWTQSIRDCTLLHPVEMGKWVVIHTQRDGGLIDDLISNLKRVGSPVGLRINNPSKVSIPTDNPNAYVDAIKRTCGKGSDLQMVVVILSTNLAARYNTVKTALLCDYPIPSQCIVSRTLQRSKGLSVPTKIALQINCKMGGQLWAVKIPLKKTMVVGIDVCHKVSGRSCLGFVSTDDENFVSCFSQSFFQKKGQELSSGLQSCMAGALRNYYNKNKCFPDIIICYRDGVGEGQLQAVVEFEVPQFEAAFAQLGGDEAAYTPRFSYIIVKKAHNVKLFKIGNNDRLYNPECGTTVFSGPTGNKWYDFYMVSTGGAQGTICPTHYHVAYDSSRIAAQHLQMLTYKLTHLYYNWSGCIRVPHVTQYAHKVAFLLNISTGKNAGECLANKLYFL